MKDMLRLSLDCKVHSREILTKENEDSGVRKAIALGFSIAMKHETHLTNIPTRFKTVDLHAKPSLSGKGSVAHLQPRKKQSRSTMWKNGRGTLPVTQRVKVRWWCPLSYRERSLLSLISIVPP